MREPQVRDLSLPLTAEAARELRCGDIVTVSGLLFTGRSRFHIRAVEQNVVPPLDFSAVNAFFHAGPVMRRTADGWQALSLEPTSSIRFERYGAAVVRRLTLRTLIGKTTMGAGTAAALCEVGGVYLSKIGLCGNRLAAQVRKVHDVHFLDELGKTEATWVLEVDRFGPFFVAIDAHGQGYFQQLDRDVAANAQRAAAQLGIPVGYTYAWVGPPSAAHGEGNTAGGSDACH